MTSTLERPPEAQPDSGVIEEARKRQLRYRVAAAAAAIALLAAGLAAWFIAGGGGSRPLDASARSPSAPVPGTRQRGAACSVAQGRLDGKPERALLSILGVLRRPPSPADSLPPGVSGIGDVFTHYVRRTRVIGGRSYYLYPSRQGCKPGREAIDDAALNVDLGHGLRGGVGGGGAGPSQIEAGEDASTGPPGSPTSATITMIVPDGVASVTLRYPAGRASGYSPKISPPFTVTTAPIGNEVVAAVPRSAGGGPIWQPTMIWRGSDGRVLRVFRRL
jgi:hypothetical protein